MISKTQIGNGVPCNSACALARAVAKMLRGAAPTPVAADGASRDSPAEPKSEAVAGASQQWRVSGQDADTPRRRELCGCTIRQVTAIGFQGRKTCSDRLHVKATQAAYIELS